MSELYKLPAGWEWKKLGEECLFENGDRGKNYPSKSAFVSKGIPVVSATNLTGWSIDRSKLNFITEERYNLIGGGKIKKNDILFCLRGSLGKCALVTDIERGVIASSLVIIRTCENLSNIFLMYYLNSHLIQDFINKYNNGAAQPNLSAKNLSLFNIPLPPLTEQKRIVAKLDSLFEKLDKAIELHQQNIKNANTLMASTLDKTFKKLEGEYSLEKVENIASTIQSGFPVNKKNEEPNGYVHLRTHNISINGELNFDTVIKVKLSMIKEKFSYIEKGDILFNNTNSTELVGKTAIVREDYNYAFSNHLTKIKVADSILPNFFVYAFLNLFNKKLFEKICNKWIGQSGVNTTMLKNIEIIVPPLPIQQQTVEYLDSIARKVDKIKQLNEQKLENLKALKASILDKAFRGQL
ncbi:restriction endonuclease subunit S [Francisella philomiragia]|nr:restriction endonuclease subunit S [Francisella philomiragia]